LEHLKEPELKELSRQQQLSTTDTLHSSWSNIPFHLSKKFTAYPNKNNFRIGVPARVK